jgi:sugar/nucleoside kinase (ribokinase family)
MESLGARIYFLKDGELNSIFKPALRIDAKNKIGCGDIFGAVFFYGYLTNRNIVKSLELANTAAGLTAQYADINEIEKLKEDVLSRYN